MTTWRDKLTSKYLGFEDELTMFLKMIDIFDIVTPPVY